MENWYHKLHLNSAVQRSNVSKISEIIKNVLISIGPTLDCVIQMKLVIPIFHTEFDALRVSIKRFGQIPPYGDFWWLLWLFSPEWQVLKFNDIPFRNAPLGRKKNGLDSFSVGMTQLVESLKRPVSKININYVTF